MLLLDVGGVFGLSVWSLAVCVTVVSVLLVNTDLFLTKAQQSALDTLANADLKTTTGAVQIHTREPLERRQCGNFLIVCICLLLFCLVLVCLEASGLSSLKPQLDVCGVPLYAVVKEHVGAEIDSFRPFFCGEIFLDETRRFYGNKPRKMMGLAFVRVGVWLNVLRAWRRGYVGNNIGEGFILGGLYVIGPGDQGILMEHQEKEFGHTADLRSVLEAVSRVQRAE
ncbi:hypothetical protein P4O66_011357 [Electrophorus voltai]|uniref:Peroxiredoxin-like 2A n=1 Tax=Electrophorus voltai TaxID=2609070 RepID=A0AAD8Z7G2_9TELE|nr:hypothetical protein P4O66_011357 [Electrophorus voltai]